ncbi:MAG: hypothetical protein K0S85_787 [Pseudomonas orientalis]|nr:hypothetical protein [Pseudomonas orientalis]
MLAKNVNDTACFLNERGACEFFASKLAPTFGLCFDSGQCCVRDAAVYFPPAFVGSPMNNIDPALFEEWMMTGLVTVLIIFMGFIVWDLAKKSKAGRFGSFILFFVLGLGVAAFIIKSVVIGLIESGAL